VSLIITIIKYGRNHNCLTDNPNELYSESIIMRLLVQRVSSASVVINSKTEGKISHGLLVLCGFQKGDKIEKIPRLVDKCVQLRIFNDENGKMNLSLLDVAGELLVISQFTLYANCRKGRRPSFDSSMPPDEAERMYDLLLDEFSKSGLKVESGIFGAMMEVSLVNDGPVTIMLDDAEI
jgi:D-aminoacyl-tRNA deacylase